MYDTDLALASITEDRKLYCRVSPERARCRLVTLVSVSDSMPTQKEVEDI
jgi:hypothetical protein